MNNLDIVEIDSEQVGHPLTPVGAFALDAATTCTVYVDRASNLVFKYASSERRFLVTIRSIAEQVERFRRGVLAEED